AAENSRIMGLEVEWVEGDMESLPLESEQFDVVISQFGHIFAPRPTVCLEEVLRVLKPGGVIAFSSWPPESVVGRVFTLLEQYSPPPSGVTSSTDWGTPEVVR